MADGERAKNVTEAVKNVVVALGVIVGGVWALYQFSVLLQRESAQTALALERLELNLNRFRLDEAGRQALARDDIKGGTLQIDLTTRTEVEDDRFVVLGVVEIRNVSDIRVDISLDPAASTLQMRRLMQRDNTVLSVDAQSWRPRDHRGPLAGITALPGRTLSIPFVFWVDDPGIYLVTFEAEVAEATSVTDEALRETYGLETFEWQENRIIRVAPPDEARGVSPAVGEATADIADDG